jgi:hypothetical protein
MEGINSIITKHENKMIELLADKPVRTSVIKLAAVESVGRILTSLYKIRDNAKLVKVKVEGKGKK